MPLGRLFDTACSVTAAVDPRRLAGLCKRRVRRFLPQQPQPVACALFGQHRHALAGRRITVADDQMHMRIVRVRSGLVDGGEP